MTIKRRDGTPQWVGENGSQPIGLVRVDLAGAAASTRFDEAWLQSLLHDRPSVLPIGQIEPGFGEPISLCRELPLNFGSGRSGALDNLYVTAAGGLVIVEAKLWRNPEARRTVVAQAMEYAAAIFRMSYEQLEAAVLRARTAADKPAASLFEIVRAGGHSGDEAEFVDAVSRNLRAGRAVIAVVGDGIREDILPLAELLQGHAGHRFTFALVELAVYDTPAAGVRIVIPSVLAQTKLIERGVVRVEGDATSVRIDIEPPRQGPTGQAPSQRLISISEDEFYEVLSQRDSNLPLLLKQFLGQAEQMGIYADMKGGMSLKHASPSGQALNLGTIRKDGYLDTSPSTWWGRRPLGQIYNETLASLIGGTVNEQGNGSESALRTAAGKTPRVSDLLPGHEEAWLRAMQDYIAASIQAAGPET